MKAVFLSVIAAATMSTANSAFASVGAYVITGISSGSASEGYELIAPNGSKYESIECANTAMFSSVDVAPDGTADRIGYDFKDKAACELAVAKIKKASKKYPAVIVIVDNKAEIAD